MRRRTFLDGGVGDARIDRNLERTDEEHRVQEAAANKPLGGESGERKREGQRMSESESESKSEERESEREKGRGGG